MFCGEIFHIFRALLGNHKTFMPKNGAYIAKFYKYSLSATPCTKLLLEYECIHAMHETFPPWNISRLRVICSYML